VLLIIIIIIIIIIINNKNLFPEILQNLFYLNK